MMYEIQVRDAYGNWTNDGLGDDTLFPTREEAKVCVEHLRALGDEWAAADYRIVEVS